VILLASDARFHQRRFVKSLGLRTFASSALRENLGVLCSAVSQPRAILRRFLNAEKHLLYDLCENLYGAIPKNRATRTRFFLLVLVLVLEKARKPSEDEGRERGRGGSIWLRLGRCASFAFNRGLGCLVAAV